MVDWESDKSKESVLNHHVSSSDTDAEYEFNIDPDKYEYCQSFLSNLNILLMLDSQRKCNHYFAISNDGQIYEVYTKIVGYSGAGRFRSDEVRDFIVSPRKIALDEFVSLADVRYPGIRYLYEGIHENNWGLYKNVLNDWNEIPKRREPLKKSDIDELSVRYNFKQKKVEPDDHCRLVLISEFLLGKGLSFVKASVGGGVSEVLHTGTMAYYADYDDFERFSHDFYQDLSDSLSKQEEESCGWVSSYDYGFISVELITGVSSVKIIAERSNTNVSWHNINPVCALIEETNAKIIEILGEETEITKSLLIKER